MVSYLSTNDISPGDAGVIYAQVTPHGFSILDSDSYTHALLGYDSSDSAKTSLTPFFEPTLTQFLTLQFQPPVSPQYAVVTWEQPLYTTVQTIDKDRIPVKIWVRITPSPPDSDKIKLTIEWQKASNPLPSLASPTSDHVDKAIILVDDDRRIIAFCTHAQRLFEASNISLLWNNMPDNLIETHKTPNIREIYSRVYQNHAIISLPVHVQNRTSLYTLTIVPLPNRALLLTFRILPPIKYSTNTLHHQDESIVLLTEVTIHNLSNHITTIRSKLADLSNSTKYNKESLDILNKIAQYMDESIDTFVWQLHPDNFAQKPTVLTQVDDIISDSREFLLYRQKMYFPYQKNLKIVEDLQAPPPVYAHIGALRDSIINLLNNAVDATIDGGSILVRSEYKQDSTGQNWTVITISDTGAGIAENAKIRLFEPLFTTKKPGRGTGLGLVALQRTILLLDGYIEIVSAANQGTTVRIWLPCAQKTSEIAISSKTPEEIESLNLLLVEDEPDLRKALTALLESAGHRVTNAAGYTTALQEIQRLKDHIGFFDTIILDISLPDGTGWQLVDLIHHLDPRVFVLLTSGHDIAPDNPYLTNHHLTIANVIRKPYNIKELCSRLHRYPSHLSKYDRDKPQ